MIHPPSHCQGGSHPTAAHQVSGEPSFHSTRYSTRGVSSSFFSTRMPFRSFTSTISPEPKRPATTARPPRRRRRCPAPAAAGAPSRTCCSCWCGLRSDHCPLRRLDPAAGDWAAQRPLVEAPAQVRLPAAAMGAAMAHASAAMLSAAVRRAPGLLCAAVGRWVRGWRCLAASRAPLAIQLRCTSAVSTTGSPLQLEGSRLGATWTTLPGKPCSLLGSCVRCTPFAQLPAVSKPLRATGSACCKPYRRGRAA